MNAPAIKKKLIQEVIKPLVEAAAAGLPAAASAEEASPERQRKKASRF